MLYLTLLLAFVIIYYYNKKYSYWQSKTVPHLTPILPFGNLSSLFLGRLGLGDTIKDFYQKCQTDYLGLYFITAPAILIKDPELIKTILVKDFNSFMDRGLYTDEKKEPRSGHLFRLSGHRWKRIRSKLTPAFTAGKLKLVFSTLAEVADKLKAFLLIDSKAPAVRNVEDLTTRYTADVIASAIYGLETDSFKGDNDFFLMAKDLFVSESYTRIAKAALQVFFPKIVAYFSWNTVKEAQDEFIFKVVSDVIHFRETNRVTRSDLMQLLIELKNTGRIREEGVLEAADPEEVGLTLDEIAAQAYTFFFAGFETASSTMNFLLYECAMNKKLQERIFQDIEQVLSRYDGAVTYESISEMHYLDKAISETLRKYPILPFLNRVATQNYRLADGTLIEKDTKVVISVSGLHHDEKYYPNPEQFDPERFSAENIALRHAFTYLPFGEGPRNCIGKRMGKMMVAVGMTVLLKHFEVGLCESTENPLKFNQRAYFIKTKKPISLMWTKRE